MPSNAELYTALHRGSPGDLAFYRRLTKDADRVLELGCGYGRVLRGLGERTGLVGMDIDPALLAMAERAVPAARLILGDMRRFDLDEVFDGVIIPYSGLYCLGSRQELDELLGAVARHLTPRGFLAFDAWTADGFHAEGAAGTDEEDELEPVTQLAIGSLLLDVLEKSRWRRDDQELLCTYVCRDGAHHREIRQRIRHRYFLRSELEDALGRVGFRGSWFGGFGSEPWDAFAEHTVVTAERQWK